MRTRTRAWRRILLTGALTALGGLAASTTTSAQSTAVGDGTQPATDAATTSGSGLPPETAARDASRPASVEQADALFTRGDWAAAADAYAALAAGNPYEGSFLYRLGACLVQQRRFDEAISTLTACRELGYHDRGTLQALAWCHRSRGDLDEAQLWFERLVAADPSVIDELHQPRLARALGPDLTERLFGPPLPDDVSRVDGWRADLDLMTEVLFRSHYDYDVKTPREEWDRAIGALHDAIPDLDDEQVALGFMRLVALAGDGHTCMWPMFNPRFDFHQLPLLVYPFADGFFVKAADDAHRDLVGARVLALGDLSVEDVFERSSVYVGHENGMHAKMTAPALMGTIEILHAIGATSSDEHVTLRLEAGGEERSVDIEAIPWDADLYGDRDEAPAWTSMRAEPDREPPTYLRDLDDPYEYALLDDGRIAYLRYANVFEKPDAPFAAFLDGMFASLASQPVEALVIDVRENFGGSTELYAPLVRAILRHPEFDRDGHLFTVIGRRTYSAAMNLVVDLEYWTHTLFVGEPTGSSPNFIGENKLFTLPYCGSRVSVSDRIHQHGASDSTDRRVWVAPDLVAELTSDDYRNDVDPALAAIRQRLAEQRRDG